MSETLFSIKTKSKTETNPVLYGKYKGIGWNNQDYKSLPKKSFKRNTIRQQPEIGINANYNTPGSRCQKSRGRSHYGKSWGQKTRQRKQASMGTRLISDPWSINPRSFSGKLRQHLC